MLTIERIFRWPFLWYIDDNELPLKTMDDEKILKQFAEQKAELDIIQKDVKRIKSYFFWTAVVSIVLFIVPLIGLVIVIPFYLQTITGALGGF